MDFDFSQPVQALDQVPEQFRSLYAQNPEGRFAVEDKFKSVVGALIGLNTANRTARREADDAKKKIVDLSPLSEFGADPAAIKTAFEARVAELTAKGGDAAKAVERVRSEMSAANAAALATAKQETEALRNQLYSYMVESTATAAVAEEKGVTELLMPFIRNQVKVTTEDGKFIVNVVDEKGERRYSGVTGQPMTIKELVKEMKTNERYGRLFESEKPQGGGFPPGSGRQAPPAQQQVKSSVDKISSGLRTRFVPTGRR